MMLQKHELNKNITSVADSNPLVRGPWVRIRTNKKVMESDPELIIQHPETIFSDPG
jgi:hypothetical protein